MSDLDAQPLNAQSAAELRNELQALRRQVANVPTPNAYKPGEQPDTSDSAIKWTITMSVVISVAITSCILWIGLSFIQASNNIKELDEYNVTITQTVKALQKRVTTAEASLKKLTNAAAQTSAPSTATPAAAAPVAAPATTGAAAVEDA
jgi:hypothetical protein